MGKPLFGRKPGLKRHKTPKKFDMNEHTRKNRRIEDSLNSSGDSSEEQSTLVSEEEEEVVVHKEPSMYDDLLKKLGSGCESLANAYKRRQREEEGKSDTEEDSDSGSESISISEKEDESEEGTDSESPRIPDTTSDTQESGLGVMEQNEDAGSDDDDEASDMDEHDLRANGQSATKTSVSTSSFDNHLGYKLVKGEVDNLSKRKCKYKWEVPAVDVSNCKWMGTEECSLMDVVVNSGYGLKPKLYKHWLDTYMASGGKDFHSSKQRLFFSLCNSYWDILHPNKKPFYLKGAEEDSSIMDAYIMHSLNHIFRTRDLVTKNDSKVAKHQESTKEDILNDDGFLDHGFTRPKVLFLLPLASIALRVVKRLIQLTPSTYKVNVEHLDRFSDEFGTGVAANEDENQSPHGIHDIKTSKTQKSSKPSDFQGLFGGNNNDHFMIGVKFTRRCIKLYSDFYSSDMIIASPLGLITKIGEAEVDKEKDVDYLSSIEVLIIDHADVIAMQNWSHVNSVVEQLNCIPSKQHGTDIMRIRQWYFDGFAQFYRQTIILGSYINPDINALFNHHCVNYHGKVKSVCDYKGVLPKVLLQVRQIYERFDPESIVDADDARLEYFAKKVFPKIKDSVQGGIMLFISSYFEFVRVRNFLKSQDVSFCLLGEYTKQSDISRARVWFFQGRRKIMLYTERAHFYHRYKIRGIQNLIIYSLPERKEFYPEIVNMLEGSHSMTCTVLFSRFDQLRLERIVGTAPAKRMVTSEKGVFVFC
ncbi:protein NUCLEOLAR FACTOR 1 isoform X2 [Cornus florida]|uniref:protein NUCLEOLAR FACTOR 1 isoform X2 n=1 Tax=Cornus florida TaxID=4283 RepID=UPI00289C495A|nr:protein NUCLEOLAR FACTOR 1 isoform X2 [Cornus florida]